ncbi:unnamed protein product [Danaus chrysippus]|uniref:(African queen) hypothetical protein n=1 Tax=Danaus chrysippus TaxID=151541 RepID=A0A8J2R6T8_9NEOP|nr:unnamed protein product [Danaus chrysippus]
MVVSKNSMWFVGCGMSLVGFGVLMSATWSLVFQEKIKNMMVLRNGSTSFEIWRDIPIPIYLECFLFNITNVADILMGKNVPIHVEEHGPYVFRERSTKVNITWNDNSTVTFRNQRFWYFQPEMSNGSLSDLITSINPIIATIAYTVRNEPLMLKFIIDVTLRMYHRNMFVTANASSWLFDGIQDPIMDLVENMPSLPYTIPFDRFGWFYKRNGSVDATGLFLAHTGASDFTKLGHTLKWNNSNKTVFRGQCGEVQGTTGELWNLENNAPEIKIYAADLCTYMSLAYSGDVIKKGLPGREFTANDSLFDNGHKYPQTACYCDEDSGRDCMPSGALNVSACKYGAPAFVTRPHFLGMDPYYADKIKGLQPTPINNQLPDPDTLVPMFWFREEIEVNDEYANFARSALSVRYGVPYGLYVMIALGASLLLSGLYKIRRYPLRQLRECDIAASQKFLSNNISPTVTNST